MRFRHREWGSVPNKGRNLSPFRCFPTQSSIVRASIPSSSDSSPVNNVRIKNAWIYSPSEKLSVFRNRDWVRISALEGTSLFPDWTSYTQGTSSWNVKVHTAIDNRLEGRGVRVRVLMRVRFFYSPRHPDPFWDSANLFSLCKGGLCPRW
jgi:hypothetical protein